MEHLHDIDGVDVDAEIDDHAPHAIGEQPIDGFLVVFFRESKLKVPDAVLFEDVGKLNRGVDDGEQCGIVVNVTLDEGKDATSNAAESDQHQATLDSGVDGVAGDLLLRGGSGESGRHGC